MIVELRKYASVGLLVSALLIGLAGPSRAAGAAGSGPTPLSQPEGCQNFPIQIYTPGSYILTSNIVVGPCKTTAIKVHASDVTINLNGFSIIGGCDPQAGCKCNPAPEARGIDATDQNRLVVTNGTITQFWDDGISASANCKVEEVRAVNNCGEGIICSEASLIKDNTVADNTGCGIESEDGSLVVGNVISGNGDGECGKSMEFGVCPGVETDNCTEVADPTVGYRSNVIRTSRGCNDIFGGTSLGENTCNGNAPF
jgi:hypothetical protein